MSTGRVEIVLTGHDRGAARAVGQVTSSLGQLTGHAGGTGHYWLYDVSEWHAMWLAWAIGRQLRRQAEQAARAARVTLPPDPDDPRIKSAARWLEVLKRLRTGK